jgi:glycosyltransferase involved in cell wall biosynthesis
VSSALEGVKGVHHAIEALVDYLHLFPSDRVVFSTARTGLAPDGSSMLTWLEEKLSRFMNRVQILPWLNHDDFLLEIAKSTIVLLPSIIDNLPNTLIEAMSLGKLVIVTRGSSMDEFVSDGHSGIVAETSSSGAILTALLRTKIMQDRKRHVLEQCAVRTASREFAPDIFVRRLEAIFEASIAAAVKR